MANNGSSFDKGETHYNSRTPRHLRDNNNSMHDTKQLLTTQESRRDSYEAKCSSYSSDESTDSPLDFSVKRKQSDQNESSGRESAHSPSSTVETSSFGEEHRKSTDHEDLPFCNGSLQNGDVQDQKPELGEIRSSGSPGSAPGLERMLSAFNMGLVSPQSIMGMFPAMAGMTDPRGQQNNKSPRPFKAYPKDPLAVPFGAYGLSNGFNPTQQIDPGVLQTMGMTNEDLMSLYKRQLTYIKDRNTYNEMSTKHLSRTSSIPATLTSPSSSSATMTPSSTHPHFPGGIQSRRDSATFSNGSISPLDSPSFGTTSSSEITSSGRKRPKTLPDEQKDESYWERRRKNNEAAKRSRDARRAKEDEIAIRAALLEQENLKLRVEVAALKTETAKLRCMLYNS